MADLNEVRLIGRLTRDPELRSTASGNYVASFGLATGRKYKGQDGVLRDETTFVEIACFGKLAETCSRYLAKGRQVFIGGRLRLEQWQDRQTGQNRSKLSVIAENVQFLDPKRDSAPPMGGVPGEPKYTPAPQPQSGPSDWSPPLDSTSLDEPNMDEPPF